MSSREIVESFWAAMQANDWVEVHRIVADDDAAVSEVTVSDGEQTARVVAFSTLDGGSIAHQIEYWPEPYDPRPGRADLTQPIERIP